MRIAFFMILLLMPSIGVAQLPWPAESWQESEVLTGLDDNFRNNLSGAHWNPETRTLWVVVNGPGKFLALVADEDSGGKWKIDRRDGLRGEWSPGGDLESITQANYAENAVYVMVEGQDIIRKYDTNSYGTIKLLQSWYIHALVPTSGSAGSEGIAFVPDRWLVKRGFVNPAGEPRTSKLGMGGLMFVAHQRGGRVYVFDLDPAGGAFDFVGAYMTNRPESSGLEFDRSTGLLYVWHNLGPNYLEEVDLASVARSDGQRQLRHVREWTAPRSGNLEGIAMTPAMSYEHQVWITDDDNQSGYGLMHYRRFTPNLSVFEGQVAASSDDAEQGRRAAVMLDEDVIEVTYSQVHQRVGLRFTGVQVPRKARIVSAHIQFTSAVPPPSRLLIRGQKQSDAPTFEAAPRNISSRRKTKAQILWEPRSWVVPDLAGEDQRTPDLSAVVQEIVNRGDWNPGNPMVFFIVGRGHYPVASFDHDPTAAPRLHIEYEAALDQ